MPRLARLDAFGVLQYIIIRGIERRKIFRNDNDREDFLDRVSARVAEIYGIEVDDIFLKGKQQIRVKARSLFCFWAVRELGMSLTELARRLGISVPGVGYSVERGEIMVRENDYQLIE